MNVFLVIVVAVLAGMVFVQCMAQKRRSSDLRYVSEKLGSIMANDTGERLMAFTGDKELMRLLNEINKVLEYRLKISQEHRKTEASMKKMLSNISHDLKTPLTVVLGYIETIRLDKNISNEDRSILLDRVENKAHEILELMNKFFDLAKLESGDREIPLTRVNMSEICQRNILGFYDILTSRGIEVCIDIPEYGIYVWGDEEALDRILSNLISNAIKYGSEGKVIGLSLRADDGFVYTDVWDRGKGIDELSKDRVFERMYTLEDSRNKRNQGSGLGLTITKRLVEKLNGEISLCSMPYDKTVFTFRLKRAVYHPS
ncbi:signal transduction histidine kinase [Anaerobacterium chartisolvens]|uniref:histidine kinase n=1 Tax=Anaerobacterium chartisolvens TaxID=1297424 RepID=A0A369B9S0_9FIRM|nr:sensor histidine kinase [Anaerobacterium chartisolvens]RCX18273.1 signal transduction histidine kinase [Anaerobacterium chartisolvens]